MRTIFALATLAMITAGPAVAQTDVTNSHRFEGHEITVPPPKPLVMVVITRQNLNEDYTVELRETFLPQIVLSVEIGPF